MKRALTGGFQRILDVLGEGNARLDRGKQPPAIAIFGSSKDLDLATAALHDGKNTSTTSPAIHKEAPEDCPVCWTDPHQPIRLSCGHTYCHDCFCGQCQSADVHDFPLKCLGNSSKCSHVISNGELRDKLLATEFEALLDKALDAFIRTRTQQYQFCPTADCPNIYRVTTESHTTTCQECLTTICTSCQIVSHDGLSCEENKDLRSEGAEAFRKWKESNDVRDCPKCKVAIENNDGCMHMECYSCHAHICWHCMKVFEKSSEVYGHMMTAHGTWMPLQNRRLG